MQSIIEQKQTNQNKTKSKKKNYNDWRKKSNTFNIFNAITKNKP